MSNRARVLKWLLVALLIGAALVAAVVGLNLRGEDGLSPVPLKAADAGSLARGAYLARAGNCIGCHTSRGGADYAGGRGIETPFGLVYAPNLTPDDATGLGRWSEAEFWRAMHNGRSKDGHLLYPAFPYTSFTQVSREDSAAVYEYLRSLPPVRQANRRHELRFPYDTQAALAVWRAMYFKPAAFEVDALQTAEWNRGAYLVRGLGHCAACHAERNALGGSVDELRLGGGLIPGLNWQAPSLALREGGQADFVALLKNGVSAHGSVMGPMAEVVYRSSSQLGEQDLQAMASYLRTLPVPERSEAVERAELPMLAQGQKIYANRCADCHGAHGQGRREGDVMLIPPLAGNPSVNLAAPQNTVQAILHGGFSPVTAGNPRPAGMPPFAQTLTEPEVAAVASFVRQSWGNAAPPVSALDVLRSR